MRFANVKYIYMLLLIPVLVAFLIWSAKKRTRDLTKLAESPLLKKLLQRYRPGERWLRSILLLTGILFILFALLGPQWGFQWKSVTHRGVDVIFAVDTSKSMLAEDVKPSRLERSKLLIQDLTDQLQGDRTGLITFAGTSFLQIPLTVDYNAFMQGVQALEPDIMPQGGTAIGKAIQQGISAFQNVDAQNKVLFLITDGENHRGQPIEVAKAARDAGIQLVVIGMGTRSGELIPIVEDGKRQFLKDQTGNVVKSSLDEDLLQKLARSARGTYLSGNDLTKTDRLYQQFIGSLSKNSYQTTRKREYHHRYQIFLMLGILLIAGEMLVGVRRGMANET